MTPFIWALGLTAPSPGRPPTLTFVTCPPPLLRARDSGRLLPRHVDELHGGESMSSRTTRQRGRFGRRILMLLMILGGAALSFTLGNAAWSSFGSSGTGGAFAKVANREPERTGRRFGDVPQPCSADNRHLVEFATRAIRDRGGRLLRDQIPRFDALCDLRNVPERLDHGAHLSGHQNVASNSYTYSITAVFKSWSSAATSTNVTVPAPVLASLSLEVTAPTPIEPSQYQPQHHCP